MGKLTLCEISESQLAATPVVDGQLVCCLDTGNFYRDTLTGRILLGNSFESVESLPLAPIADKLYLLRPSKLYIFHDDWICLNPNVTPTAMTTDEIDAILLA